MLCGHNLLKFQPLKSAKKTIYFRSLLNSQKTEHLPSLPSYRYTHSIFQLMDSADRHHLSQEYFQNFDWSSPGYISSLVADSMNHKHMVADNVTQTWSELTWRSSELVLVIHYHDKVTFKPGENYNGQMQMILTVPHLSVTAYATLRQWMRWRHTTLLVK